MTTAVDVKFCTKCCQDRPIDHFHRDASKNGLRAHCRACRSTDKANSRAEVARRKPVRSPKAGFEPGPNWQMTAACRWEEPDLFFPIGNTGEALLQIEEAKAVCRRCPAMEACLAWALDTGQDAGVWGGMSEDERRALKRKAARNRSKASA